MTDDGSDEGVLSPDDLDVREDERVVELEENRFFVSTSGSEPAETESDRLAPGSTAGSGAPAEAGASDSGTHDALADVLDDATGRYAIAAAARTDAGVAEHVVDSNNVAETFEAFLTWYAGLVGDGRTPPDEVLRILLAETDLDV